MYSLIRPLLFRLEPETAHRLTLKTLSWLPKFCFRQPDLASVNTMGLHFPHRIGLAAGLDKNAEYLDALSKLGFSFIEVGTVTPRPQAGNPSPRLFRLPEAHALINRMGFNNHGVDALVNNIRSSAYTGRLGINIGKNKDTGLNHAAEDYLYCLDKVYPYASYITINISSPNTPDLRKLQQKDYLQQLLSAITERQKALSDEHRRHVPLVLKLSPDEPDERLKEMTDLILQSSIEGVIATNTTADHSSVEHLPESQESGGLSGRPLRQPSTDCLRLLKEYLGDRVCLIASGGIDSPESAQEKLAAGAVLLQLYTGLIYQGPGLVARLSV